MMDEYEYHREHIGEYIKDEIFSILSSKNDECCDKDIIETIRLREDSILNITYTHIIEDYIYKIMDKVK